MVELKAFRIKEVEDGCPFWQAEYEVYSKSKADEVIEALNRQINSQEVEIRHHKYKRCLSMMMWCASRAVMLSHYGNEKDSDWFWKWKDKWKKLAEQFKATE